MFIEDNWIWKLFAIVVVCFEWFNSDSQIGGLSVIPVVQSTSDFPVVGWSHPFVATEWGSRGEHLAVLGPQAAGAVVALLDEAVALRQEVGLVGVPARDPVAGGGGVRLGPF